MDLNRGDICLVNFNPAKGGEIGKLRPAIVMSESDDIETLETLIVIPLSTVLLDDALPYRYRVTKRNQLLKESDACLYEIHSLSKIRVKERLAQLTKDELQTVQENLCKILN